MLQCSQEVELLVQRHNCLVDVAHTESFLLAVLGFMLVAAAVSLPGQHVELRNLVSVLARCRDLDWASPVEVEVAQREG